MTGVSLRLLTAAMAASLLSGCNPVNAPNSTTSTPGLTGNWEFTTLYPGSAVPNIVFTGALNQQGTNVTAILRNSCFGTQDIDFSGAEDAMGNLTLASTNLASTTVTVTGAVPISGGAIQGANYKFVETGSAPCAPLTATLYGSQYPSFTGNFAGSVNSIYGVPANFAVDLAQGPVNADGQFPLTGTVTVSSSTCTATFPLSLALSGGGFTTNLVSSSGPASTAAFNAGPVLVASPSLLANFFITLTGCNPGTYTGSLYQQ